MLVCPASRLTLIAVLRRAAMTCGPAPVRTAEWSSPKVTSRTQCRVLSGSPGALLLRGPLRTVRATSRGTRLRQPQGGAGSAVVEMVLLRLLVGLVAQPVCTRRWVVGRLPEVGPWWVSTLRTVRYHCSHWLGESGGRSVCSSGSPQAGQRPCWARMSRSQDGARAAGLLLRIRSAQ